MPDLILSGARLLHGDGSIGPGSISGADGRIAAVSTEPARMTTDAGRYLVLPGIPTAKPTDVDPQAWLADVLARITDTPQTKLVDLLPWKWRAQPMRQKAA